MKTKTTRRTALRETGISRQRLRLSPRYCTEAFKDHPKFGPHCTERNQSLKNPHRKKLSTITDWLTIVPDILVKKQYRMFLDNINWLPSPKYPRYPRQNTCKTGSINDDIRNKIELHTEKSFRNHIKSNRNRSL